MSFPKPVLAKYYCENYQFLVSVKLDEKELKELVTIEGLKDLADDTPVIDERTYSKQKNKLSMLLLMNIGKSKKKKGEFFFRAQFYFTPISEGENGDTNDEINFTNLFKFFANTNKDLSCSAIAHFAFPQNKMKPIMPLPYTRDDLPLKTKIQIRGLDLELGEGSSMYRQHIAVYDNDSVYQRVGLFDINEECSIRLIENTLAKTYEYAKLLMKDSDDKRNKSKK